MSNNFDDFDDTPPNMNNEAYADEDVVQEPRQRASIGETLKTNPAFKIFLILIAGGALASAALGVFSDKEDRKNNSIVSQPGEVTSTPGGEASPAFTQAVVEASQQRAAGAVEGGGSAMPTPLGGEQKITTLEPSDISGGADPLSEYRPDTQKVDSIPPMEEERSQNTAPFGSNPYAPPQVQAGPAYDQNTVNTMQQQMQSLVSSWQPATSKVLKVTAEQTVDPASAAQQQQQQQQTQDRGKILVPAGTVNYGQLLIEANSDIQGPVMAQIASGPFAGGKAIGSFQVVEEYDYLVVRFSLINFKGKDYPADILALDPDTTLGGMATDVDHRYWSRIVFPAAAGFLSGFANAFAQADQQVTVDDGVVISTRTGNSLRRGLGEGFAATGDRMSEILEQQGNRIRPLVKIAAGTPIGLFFVSSIYENQPTQDQQTSPFGYSQSQYGLGTSLGSGYSTNPYAQQNGTGIPISQVGNQYLNQYGNNQGYNSQNYNQSGYNTGSNTSGYGYNSSGRNNSSGVSIIQNGGYSRQPVYMGQ